MGLKYILCTSGIVFDDIISFRNTSSDYKEKYVSGDLHASLVDYTAWVSKEEAHRLIFIEARRQNILY